VLFSLEHLLQVISLAIAVVDKYKVVKGAVRSGVDRRCHLVRGGRKRVVWSKEKTGKVDTQTRT